MTIAEEKKQAILSAASKIFQQDGYEKANTAKIAELANVSKRTLFKYYPSKLELFRHVLADFVAQIMQDKKLPFDRSLAIDEQLKQILRLKISILQSESFIGLAKVGIPELLRNGENAAHLVSLASQQGGPFYYWLHSAADQGFINESEVEFCCLAFHGLVDAFFSWPQLLRGAKNPTEQETNELVEKLSQFCQLYFKHMSDNSFNF